MVPKNIDTIETLELTSSSTDDAQWVGGYFTYGGEGAEASTTVYFAVPPGKRLGPYGHGGGDTVHPLRQRGSPPRRRPEAAGPGDVVVLTEGTFHDLHNTGSEDLRVIGFFSAPGVEQHWSEEVWEPGDLKVTGTPNTPGGS